MIAGNTALKNGMVQVRDFIAGGGQLTPTNVATFLGITAQQAGGLLLILAMIFEGHDCENPSGPGTERERMIWYLNRAIETQISRGA